MKKKLYSYILVVSTLTIYSCASYKQQYSKEVRNWEHFNPSPDKPLKHVMYLIGDAGDDAKMNTRRAPVIKYLKAKMATESKNSSALFLGDNIYPSGMPPREDVENRSDAEFRITAQLEILDDFKGKPFFIPGNHDWRGWGRKGLIRQANFIEDYLNKRHGKTDKDQYETYFIPKDGCSGPEVIELNDDVVIIAVDSQWWLADWDKDTKINDGCENRNRETFRFNFENAVRKYRNKNIVIAMHHPPYTYGPHGGKYTLKQWVFPLTQIDGKDKWYIPLPALGTIAGLFRGTIGSRQDMANKHYRDFRTAILSAAKKNGNFIIASGHEHALQFIENDGQEFIVSGSGSKRSPVGMGKGTQFKTGELGYSTISFYEGGETWVQYWQVDTSGISAKLVFRKKIKDKLPVQVEEARVDMKEYEQHADSSSQMLIRYPVKPIGNLHKIIFGEHNRSLYLEKYQFPVLDLNTFKGGVIAGKMGGGNQTNSLRVHDESGKEYVLRGMTKDVSRFLPFPFNKMVAAKFLAQENFLSTHPFAPTAVPFLAEAINVYHPNPQIYYTPTQQGLSPYNQIFGHGMNLVEERPTGKKWKKEAFFGNADRIESTPEMLENLLDKNKYKVDEAWALRTRLLDFVIGDWDRHDDQWAWAAKENKDGKVIYRPIPKDRDQAFSKYDGIVTNLASFTMPFLRQLQSFGPNVKSLKWNTWSARLFDRTFLNGLSWEQWEEQVEYVQAHLTDDVIEQAFRNWPTKAQQISSPFLITSIKARRDKLMEMAKVHYSFIGQSVNIIGTEEKERFEVNRFDDSHTQVTAFEITKKGRKKELTYQRTFDHRITKAINIYGNGDDDDFMVTGNVNKGTLVRLIGGTGKDVFTDSSEVKSGPKKTVVYDDLGVNTVNPGKETLDKRTRQYRFNIYDRRSSDSNYDITMPLPIVGFNPDDGLLVGANFNVIKYGFKKEPYASVQNFGGSYAFSTHAFKLHYTGDFISAFKKFDFYLQSYYHGPTYAFNYTGLGNASTRIVDPENYYRVRQSAIHIYPAIKKSFAGNSSFVALGPTFEISDIHRSAGRFITTDGSGLTDDIFKTKYFAGAKLLFDVNSVDNYYAPHHGVHFSTEMNLTSNLKEDRTYAGLRAQLAIYQSLDQKENFVLASQIGTGINFGDGYEFFQMPVLGGIQGLRGYRNQRFYGKSSLWHSTDLRIRFGSSYNPTLPLTYGMFGSFDHGRVWLKNEHSGNWHYSYGGGIWLAPVDVLTISIGAFIPKEEAEQKPRIAFQLGFAF
jgi:hypothetical protein